MSKFDQFVEDNHAAICRFMDIAEERYRDDALVMSSVEAQIRGGKDYPMFAPGDAGVAAARALAENLTRMSHEVRELREELLQLIYGEENADLPAA
jgi:hypothetical protein